MFSSCRTYCRRRSTIENVDHILRGYENIIEKLSGVGAKIELVDIK